MATGFAHKYRSYGTINQDTDNLVPENDIVTSDEITVSYT